MVLVMWRLGFGILAGCACSWCAWGWWRAMRRDLGLYALMAAVGFLVAGPLAWWLVGGAL